MSAENLAVIRAAQQKRARRRKQRMALLTALTSMMLATSLLTSFLQAAFDFMRNIWRMMPWGVLILLGATHVASELLQTCDLPQEVLRVASTSFWEERSPLEAQAVLAFATSVMAETTDKRVLVEIMTPAVAHIAEIQRMYPAYYAIPVIVGASSNFIMPASMPLALLHEVARVQFWKLVGVVGCGKSKSAYMRPYIVTEGVQFKTKRRWPGHAIRRSGNRRSFSVAE
ncbi:uncharacterized protein LOC119445118 [Dermacentor silvarum]|uniref:uncharacterized protein LOC119445118 n=1 Tax=Dermacentor silvarum TaxID=543639 RepID=UPI00210079D9|nr:uncharacterized protein LOC119445118 [Dermacentor silvarum]